MPKFVKSSFLEEFELPSVSHEALKSEIAKIKTIHTVSTKSKSISNLSLEEKLKLIEKEVYKTLGRYKGFVEVIYDIDTLNKYIDKAIEFNCIAVDTETNKSLDPLTCKLVGLCLYVPNMKPVYVPVSHCIPGTDELLKNQVTPSQLSSIFDRLKNTQLIYHNAKFDMRVIKNTVGNYPSVWWDTLIASQVIDENEIAKLKFQFHKHIDPTINVYDIEKLFTVPYEWISPEVFALYAATDSYDTCLLQQQQEKVLSSDDMTRVKKLFTDIEMPVVPIVAKMEDDGICVDMKFLKKLHEKYTEEMNNALDTLNNALAPYKETIKKYQLSKKLSDPVNFESPVQLKLVLYDIMGTTPLEEGSTATDKTTLKLLKTPFTKALLDFRHYAKLVQSFTSPLQEKISKKDGKLHSNFFQMGAEDNNVVTGRFSSKNPNLQQMPSKEKCVRMMFMASTEEKNVEVDGNKLVFDLYSEIETPNGWYFIDKLNVGDSIYLYDEDAKLEKTIKNINITDKIYMEIE